MNKNTVIIDEDVCKGCSLCISVCPVKILELSKTRVNSKGYAPCTVTTNEKCIGCTNCALMCPDSAISITEE